MFSLVPQSHQEHLENELERGVWEAEISVCGVLFWSVVSVCVRGLIQLHQPGGSVWLLGRLAAAIVRALFLSLWSRAGAWVK